jgi:hypothetical protein
MRLPPELMYPILRDACTDDGKTGCALSTVSLSIRGISSRTRYNSVALRGARQIRSFLALVVRTSSTKAQKDQDSPKEKRSSHKAIRRVDISDLTIHVKHLFLADRTEDRQGENPSWTEWHKDPDAGVFSKLVRKVVGNGGRTKHWISDSTTSEAVIQSLLTALAPKLEHLCFEQSMLSTFHYVPVQLPVLVELTCCFRHPWNSSTWSNQATVPFRQQLPALERFHVVTGKMEQGFVRFDAERDLPPSLSLVRFSDFNNSVYLLSILHPEANPWTTQQGLDMNVPKKPASTHLSATSHGRDLLKKTYVVGDREAYQVDVHRLYNEWLTRVHGGAGEGYWKDGVPYSSLVTRP